MSQNIYSEDSYNVLNYANSQRYFRMNFLQFEQSQNAVVPMTQELVIRVRIRIFAERRGEDQLN